MIWLSWVMALTVYGGFFAQAKNPIRYSTVGSDPMVHVVNNGPDTVAVLAMAPEVDNAIRGVGLIMPRDSADLKLPYSGTRVFLLLITRNGGYHKLMVVP